MTCPKMYSNISVETDMADGGDEVEAGYPEQFLKVYKESIMAFMKFHSLL
jgi:hypothetical protein